MGHDEIDQETQPLTQAAALEYVDNLIRDRVDRPTQYQYIGTPNQMRAYMELLTGNRRYAAADLATANTPTTFTMTANYTTTADTTTTAAPDNWFNWTERG